MGHNPCAFEVYLAIGKGCFGFAPSDSALTHLWSYEGFLEEPMGWPRGSDGRKNLMGFLHLQVLGG